MAPNQASRRAPRRASFLMMRSSTLGIRSTRFRFPDSHCGDQMDLRPVRRAARWHHRRPGSGRGAGAGLCRAPEARPAHARRGAAGQCGLCRTRRRDRGGLAAAGGLGAGALSALGRGRAGHHHGGGHCVGVSGAFLRSGAAIGAKRLCAHSGQPGRLGPHAGRGQRGDKTRRLFCRGYALWCVWG